MTMKQRTGRWLFRGLPVTQSMFDSLSVDAVKLESRT
jgi:hypothetical protein